MTQFANSKLMLLIPNSEEVRYRLSFDFASMGVRPERIEFVYRSSSADYLDRYNQIDIALDPVPFNGHTTTCDAAWMGCPTITLSGDTFASRYGGSVLRNIGLSDLIATDEAEYVRHRLRPC